MSSVLYKKGGPAHHDIDLEISSDEIPAGITIIFSTWCPGLWSAGDEVTMHTTDRHILAGEVTEVNRADSSVAIVPVAA